MRMLSSADDETDVEVTWVDQQKINTFSRLNKRLQDIEENLEKKKQDKEALDDLSTELELADEDDVVMYKIGDTFVHIPLPRAQKLLIKDVEEVDSQLASLKNRAEECENTMKQLKVELYAKFGKAINLDA